LFICIEVVLIVSFQPVACVSYLDTIVFQCSEDLCPTALLCHYTVTSTHVYDLSESKRGGGRKMGGGGSTWSLQKKGCDWVWKMVALHHCSHYHNPFQISTTTTTLKSTNPKSTSL